MNFEQFATSSHWVQQNNGHVPKDKVNAFIQMYNLLDPRESIG